MHTETRVLCQQAKEYGVASEPPDAGRGLQQSPLGRLRRRRVAGTLTLDVWLPGLGDNQLSCLRHSVCGTLLWQTQHTNHLGNRTKNLSFSD